MWQGSPPGSIYDYVQVASFSLGPDGRVDQWSERAAELLGVPAHEAIGRDPVEVFVPHELREQGHRKVAELLDGREWTGLVPYLRPKPTPSDQHTSTPPGTAPAAQANPTTPPDGPAPAPGGPGSGGPISDAPA
ncbi:PAS domain-containing protein, partial [Streptomyces sp. AC536]|nr:PAS domain-containing protein [Streptomyces buecherae]